MKFIFLMCIFTFCDDQVPSDTTHVDVKNVAKENNTHDNTSTLVVQEHVSNTSLSVQKEPKEENTEYLEYLSKMNPLMEEYRQLSSKFAELAIECEKLVRLEGQYYIEKYALIKQIVALHDGLSFENKHKDYKDRMLKYNERTDISTDMQNDIAPITIMSLFLGLMINASDIVQESVLSLWSIFSKKTWKQVQKALPDSVRKTTDTD